MVQATAGNVTSTFSPPPLGVKKQNPTSVGFCQGPHDREPQPCAGPTLVSTPEPVGGPLFVVVGKARPTVGNGHHVRVGIALDRHGHGGTGRCHGDSVVDEVVENLLNRTMCDSHNGATDRSTECNVHLPLSGGGRPRVDPIGRQLHEVDLFNLSGTLCPAQFQQLFNQGGQALGFVHYRGEVLILARSVTSPVERLRRTANGFAAGDLSGRVVLEGAPPEFTAGTVPRKLLAAHRTAEGVWGHPVVREGRVDFVFEDDPDHVYNVEPGSPMPIPPGRSHRLSPSDDAVFAVEFHRPAGA
ncbi:MAG: DUF1971 domain-containing protein [Acidimicrobiales bacterium]|nr:DUF1971 domain-containing protein [Acidimicrobiales bacterium]